jgi:opacity protein-like surface antigen
MLLLADSARATDLPLKAPALKALYDWTGFYVGGHFGYGGASFGTATNPLPLEGEFLPHSATGLIGGYQVGYAREFANHVVLGFEADATFASPTDQAALGRTPPTPFNTTLDYVGTTRGRIGYAFDRWMPYFTGGFAWGHPRIDVNDGSGASVKHYQFGWTAGLGLEFAVSGNWSAKLEYDYVDLSRHFYDLSGFGLPGVNVDPRIHLAKVGLNYHFDDTLSAKPIASAAKPRLPESDDWNVHVQTTVLPQGPRSARPIPAPSACRPAARSRPPGPRLRFLVCGSGKAASSISTRSSRRALASTAHLGSPASPMAKRRRRARNIRGSARSATTSSRPSASAASRKTSPTDRTSWPASATSTASHSSLGGLPSATSSTTTPTRTTRARIS